MCLQDREQGDRLKLKEIQKLVDDDTSMQNLSEAKQKDYIDELQLHRDTKKVGARSSNVAAAVDCRSCITKVSTEVCMLIESYFGLIKSCFSSEIYRSGLVCAPWRFSHVPTSTTVLSPRGSTQMMPLHLFLRFSILIQWIFLRSSSNGPVPGLNVCIVL